MKTLGRNGPCPCGSSKKSKGCYAEREEPQAVSKVINWLMAKYPHAVHEALDHGFFGSLGENEGKILHAHKPSETPLIKASE